MSCFIAGTLPTGRHRCSAIFIALCLTLVSAVAFGSIAASARAAEDPLLARVHPSFAPVIHPTLETGVQAITAAALDALEARPRD